MFFIMLAYFDACRPITVWDTAAEDKGNSTCKHDVCHCLYTLTKDIHLYMCSGHLDFVADFWSLILLWELEGAIIFMIPTIVHATLSYCMISFVFVKSFLPLFVTCPFLQ